MLLLQCFLGFANCAALLGHLRQVVPSWESLIDVWLSKHERMILQRSRTSTLKPVPHTNFEHAFAATRASNGKKFRSLCKTDSTEPLCNFALSQRRKRNFDAIGAEESRHVAEINCQSPLSQTYPICDSSSSITTVSALCKRPALFVARSVPHSRSSIFAGVYTNSSSSRHGIKSDNSSAPRISSKMRKNASNKHTLPKRQLQTYSIPSTSQLHNQTRCMKIVNQKHNVTASATSSVLHEHKQSSRTKNEHSKAQLRGSTKASALHDVAIHKPVAFVSSSVSFDDKTSNEDSDDISEQSTDGMSVVNGNGSYCYDQISSVLIDEPSSSSAIQTPVASHKTPRSIESFHHFEDETSQKSFSETSEEPDKDLSVTPGDDFDANCCTPSITGMLLSDKYCTSKTNVIPYFRFLKEKIIVTPSLRLRYTSSRMHIGLP